ncbi:MAG: MATE family efflux transporter [Clostridiales bacterium]|nr:MAG: MATE family efflux transporter [Clostridiales bacterium]
MERDLTVGKPITAILKYTLPLFGSIIFQQLYNIADSLVAGRYIGTDALAAVGNGYEITLLFIAVAFGCNIGTSVITARYFGKKDIRGVKTTVSTALIVSTVIAVILTALGLGLTKPLLHLIKNRSRDFFTDSYEYLMIYLGGYIFLLSYNIATGIFSALGDSLTPFLFLAVSSVANVIVDIVFVKKPFIWALKGVAWATFICQGVSAILALAFMFVRLRKLPHEGDEKIKKVDFKILKEISVVAIPSILQQAFISVGNIIIQGFINAFGAWATGGYAAAIKLNNMAVTSVVALGNGMSNFSAQNMGAGKPERIKKGIFGAIGMGAVISLLFHRDFSLDCPSRALRFFITDGNADAIGTGVNFLKNRNSVFT